jgi:enoyl-CoA hydratase
MVEIVLDGPAKNALGTRMLQHVKAEIEAADGAPILLTGAGDAFSAGLDLREISSLDAAGIERFLRLLVDTVEALFRHPGPSVAAVNGHAIAGGCVLAAACDHRVGTSLPTARIALNEVGLGLRFPPLMLAVLRYRLPQLEAVILDAGMFPPPDALRLGLVDELADDPLAVARANLTRRAAHPPAAYAATKLDLRAVVRADPGAELAFVQEVLPTWTSEALQQRIRAFLERKPR